MEVQSADRKIVGTHLAALLAWMPDVAFRLELVRRRRGGRGYDLDASLVEAVAKKLAEMAGLAVGELKLPVKVRAALLFFGVAIPALKPGPKSAENAVGPVRRR